MIRLDDLEEAISECQGQRNPNADTCIKLAAYLTIKRELYGAPIQSFAAPEEVTLNSGTEFAEAVEGLSPSAILPVMDELMTTLQVVNPRLYAAVMRQIEVL